LTEILFFLFIAGFLIQSLYFLFIFSKLIFYKEKNRNEVDKTVSVIIAAHNEKENLKKLVPLLLNQQYSPFEIIIADDRSTDGTDEFLHSIKDPRIKVLRIDQTPPDFNSKKYALTKAIESAKNELILLTDADCVPNNKFWIQQMQAGFYDDAQIVLGYSPYQKRPGFLNLFIRYETFYTAIQYLSFALLKSPYMGVGRNLSYYKKLFIDNEGFSKYKSITGGDDDLLIGKFGEETYGSVNIKIHPDSIVFSVPKDTYKQYFKQKLRHLGVGKYYSLVNKLKTGLLVFSQLILYISFIVLSFSNIDISIVLSIFILRTLVLIAIFAVISKKLGETIKWLWFPILDLTYLVYYIIVGISAVFSKNIKWT
jgi:glycosyltransferase involved in cell wall biosynthesis